jgi:hypothetical protein
MWNAKAHEAKRVCSKVKHILTSEGDCKRLGPVTPKCIPTLGITLVSESQMFRALVEKAKKHQIGPP